MKLTYISEKTFDRACELGAQIEAARVALTAATSLAQARIINRQINDLTAARRVLLGA